MKKLIITNIILAIVLIAIPEMPEIKDNEIIATEDSNKIVETNNEEKPTEKNYSLTTDMDLRIASNLEANEYDIMLSGTNLEGIGKALEQAEKEFGVNGLYLLGLCCLESGYGTSGYAVNRNNLVRLECGR